MDWDKLDKKKLADGVLEAVGGLGGAAGDAAMPGVGTGIRAGAGGLEKLVDMFMPDASGAKPAPAPAPTPAAAPQPAPPPAAPARKRSRTRHFDAPVFSRPRSASAEEIAAAAKAEEGELVKLPDGRLALVEEADAEESQEGAPAVQHIVILRKPKSG